MKKVAIILIIAFIALPVSAHQTGFRAYYQKTGKTYACDRVQWGTLGTYCYSFNTKGVLISHGIGTLQEWTGLYDSAGIKIYEDDTISTPGIPNGIVQYGSTTTYMGWYILGTDGKAYTLNNLSNLPKTQWSTVIH